MYGLIGKMTAAPGKRDELISILLEGVAAMPNRRSGADTAALRFEDQVGQTSRADSFPSGHSPRQSGWRIGLL